jgi:hypothetical protein
LSASEPIPHIISKIAVIYLAIHLTSPNFLLQILHDFVAAILIILQFLCVTMIVLMSDVKQKAIKEKDIHDMSVVCIVLWIV